MLFQLLGVSAKAWMSHVLVGTTLVIVTILVPALIYVFRILRSDPSPPSFALSSFVCLSFSSLSSSSRRLSHRLPEFSALHVKAVSHHSLARVQSFTPHLVVPFVERHLQAPHVPLHLQPLSHFPCCCSRLICSFCLHIEFLVVYETLIFTCKLLEFNNKRRETAIIFKKDCNTTNLAKGHQLCRKRHTNSPTLPL